MNRMKEKQNQRLYQFLAKINQASPPETRSVSLEERYVQQYIVMVNTTFGANVLHKGLTYANRLYNHIVKVEYRRLCRLVIKQELEEATVNLLLYTLSKTKEKLLSNSPTNHSQQGLDIFYQFIGGNRQKYQANRKSINKIYQLLKQESNR